MSISDPLTPSASINASAFARVLVLVAKPGIAIGQDVGPRQAEAIHGPGGHDQRLGGIEATRDADHHPRYAGAQKPLLQPMDLDVVGLVAACIALRGISGHVGEAGHRPAQRHRALGHPEGELHPAHGAQALPVLPCGVVEAGEAHPLLEQPVKVDIPEHQLLVLGEPRCCGQLLVVLVDQRVAIPGKVGGRFAKPGGGVEIGGHAAPRLRGAEGPPVVGLADGAVAGREVRQDRSLSQRGEGARRNRAPDVFADLGMDSEAV